MIIMKQKKCVSLTVLAALSFFSAYIAGENTTNAGDNSPLRGKVAMNEGARPGQGATPAGKAVSAPSADEPIRITISDALLMALERNRALAVERMNPSIKKTFEQQQQAAFDSIVSAGISGGRERAEQARSTGTEDFTSDTVGGSVAIEKNFPTGTTILAKGTLDQERSTQIDGQFIQSGVGLTVTQALLRGYSVEVNLANIRQTRLDTEVSLYELRGFSEALVGQIETAYWDYDLSVRQIRIVEESLQLALLHKKETEGMIDVGNLAESELVAAQAEISSRRQDLIEARSAMEVKRLRLLRLLNPPGVNPFKREIVLISQPDLRQPTLDDVDSHVALGLKLRPDLNQARLGLQRDDLEIVKTKNGLLPKLDFFVTLGKTGYADSFGSSIGNIGGGHYEAYAGLNFKFPPNNQDATARHRRSILNRRQAEIALENLAQLVELDIRTAYIEVLRSLQQIDASLETRKLEEEKMRVENEKFQVGKSTNFLLAQAQRDLLLSRLNESEAVSSYLRALTELFRLEGSILERRGIATPKAP